ncbi:GNAT family N-acetyltransferase [Desulforhabdus sp. TSK]|uniref:GNAT family N-acetyltransferase n=1 Tax=Desulforhabdus sp. TSK TaxID=2925014 RepID=UPI001FC84C3A|nr:GNAT family N-acetyltransferase [Desulforhabdus sp. TSK]GKT09730.1 hypothetical protein DSTSK_30350 [Desulforhabdus sp. TSK]
MEFPEGLADCHRRKIKTARESVSLIRRGSRVFIGTGCGEPRHLVEALIDNQNLKDIVIYQMLSSALAQYVDDESFLRRFLLKTFFISSPMRRAAFEGKIDYIATHLSQIPSLFHNHIIALDIALIAVSAPDKFGYCSLGISVDVTKAAAANAGFVIAQVNPLMPRTLGDSYIHLDDIDCLVLHEEPLVETFSTTKENEISKRIGYYVSQLVEDGATLQLGFGQLPNALLKYLKDKKNLGMHTPMITDALLPLFESGVINNKEKTLLPGKVVTSMCMGTQKVYDYVDNNPTFYFASSEFVNSPATIALNDRMISIGTALEVDITGQICSESLGYLFYSGMGDQADSIRGSAMSKGGISIIALPSTAHDGAISRIVPHLSEGAGVTSTRGDIHFVVTEYGIAELQGKGIYERVVELAQIAHPKFRKDLIDMAKKHHYIFPDQLPPPEEDLIFLERYKSSIQLKDDRIIELRPLLPSDELAYGNFMYSLEKSTLYYRFFSKMMDFSHEVVQKHWSFVDYRRNMSIIGLARSRGYKQIVAVASYAEMEENRAEVAFVVREDFQSAGVGSRLLEVLERIAKENGYKGFFARVLRENSSMFQVFKKKYPRLKGVLSGSEIEVTMDFDSRSITSPIPEGASTPTI